MTKKFTMSAAFMAAVMFAAPSFARDQVDPAGTGQANDNADVANLDQTAGQAAGDNAAAQPAAARQGKAAQAGQVNEMDQKFAMKAADTNNFEIQSAKLAMQKAPDNQQIKEFAQHVLKDHQKSNQMLATIAQSKGIQLPQDLMPVHKAMLEELSQKEGVEFERGYLIGQVAGHVKSVLKFRDATEMLQDPELKAFATQQLPALRKHLEHAQQAAGAGSEITASFREGGANGAAGHEHDAAGHSKDAAGGQQGTTPDAGAGAEQTPGAIGGDAAGGATGGDAAGGASGGAPTPDASR